MSTTTTAPERLTLDLAEAAALMDVGYRTAKAIIARNRDGQNSSLGDGLPAVKIGGKWKVIAAPFYAVFGGPGEAS